MKLKFNPDFNTAKEVRDAAYILRELVRRRTFLQECAFDEAVCDIDKDNLAQRFMESFDTMTHNVEVGGC